MSVRDQLRRMAAGDDAAFTAIPAFTETDDISIHIPSEKIDALLHASAQAVADRVFQARTNACPLCRAQTMRMRKLNGEVYQHCETHGAVAFEIPRLVVEHTELRAAPLDEMLDAEKLKDWQFICSASIAQMQRLALHAASIDEDQATGMNLLVAVRIARGGPPFGRSPLRIPIRSFAHTPPIEKRGI